MTDKKLNIEKINKMNSNLNSPIINQKVLNKILNDNTIIDLDEDLNVSFKSKLNPE
jgi:hypothetical protein